MNTITTRPDLSIAAKSDRATVVRVTKFEEGSNCNEDAVVSNQYVLLDECVLSDMGNFIHMMFNGDSFSFSESNDPSCWPATKTYEIPAGVCTGNTMLQPIFGKQAWRNADGIYLG